MKLVRLLFLIGLSLFNAAVHAHGEAGPPKHGGVVALVNDVEYELVVQPDLTSLYVRDHDGAVKVSGATAKLSLLSGGQTQQVVLKDVGDHLEAQGGFSVQTGAKAVAIFELPGKKPVTIRFVWK